MYLFIWLGPPLIPHDASLLSVKVEGQLVIVQSYTLIIVIEVEKVPFVFYIKNTLDYYHKFVTLK